MSNDCFKHILNPSTSTDLDVICETVETVIDFIVEHGADRLDLTTLVGKPVSGEHLAALLRTTYQWRNQVPGWFDSLPISRAALIEQGLDPEDALYGLE